MDLSQVNLTVKVPSAYILEQIGISIDAPVNSTLVHLLLAKNGFVSVYIATENHMSDQVLRCQRRRALFYAWLIFAGIAVLTAGLNWWQYQQIIGSWVNAVLVAVCMGFGLGFLYRFHWEYQTDICILYDAHVDYYIWFRMTPFRISYENIKRIDIKRQRKVIIEFHDGQTPFALSLAYFEYPEAYLEALNKMVQRYQRDFPKPDD